jgi:6-phosphogluconolactonase
VSDEPILVSRMEDAAAVAQRAADLVVAAIASARTLHGAAHIALAGGTTPRRCYELLSTMLDDWSDVHLWYGDERCVPPDDPDANALMVHQALRAPGAVEHRMRGELGPDAGAAQYAQELGDTVLDLTLLGIGPDGHTASLFPNHPLLEATGIAVGVHDSPKPPPERITLTLGKLNESRRIVVLADGAGKADAVARILAGPDRATPASLLDHGRTELVVDPAALGAPAADG